MSDSVSNRLRYILDARTANRHFPGIGRYISNLTTAMVPLLEEDERLILLRPEKPDELWNLPEESAAGNIVHRPVAESVFSPKQQFTLPRLLTSLKADLYHSPYYLMPYRPGIPTVLTVYDVIPRVFPRFFSAKVRLLFRVAMPLAIHAADRIITISNHSTNDLHAFYPGSKSKPVNPVLLAPDTHFSKDNGKRKQHELFSSIPRLSEKPYVLTVGINKPHKNQGFLVETWAQLRKKNPLLAERFNLVIAGPEDSRYPEVRETVKRTDMQDHVLFTGTIPTDLLPALYSQATLFTFPSLYEGFGFPVIEAMACGTPVISSNSASLPEVAGDAAILLEPKNHEAWGLALTDLLENAEKRRELEARGLNQAKKFSWENTARGTLKVWRELAS